MIRRRETTGWSFGRKCSVYHARGPLPTCKPFSFPPFSAVTFFPPKAKKGRRRRRRKRKEGGFSSPPPSSSTQLHGLFLLFPIKWCYIATGSLGRSTDQAPPSSLAGYPISPDLLPAVSTAHGHTHTQPRKKRRRQRSKSHLISRPQPFPPPLLLPRRI